MVQALPNQFLDGKFSIQIGPIQADFSVPVAWIPSMKATWSPWQTKLQSEGQDIIHHATVRIFPATSPDGASIHVLPSTLKKSTSHWEWPSDPRYWQDEDWLDWRGVKADRRRHIDFGLRNILTHVGEVFSGALMHAAAVTLDGGAFVAPGRSGRGKTTFFNLLGGYEAGHLHEDITFILDGQVYSLPCQSSNTHWNMPKPLAYPLIGFVDLARGTSVTAYTIVDIDEKLKVVGSSIVPPLANWEENQADDYMSKLIRLASTTSCIRLVFSLTASPDEVSKSLLKTMEGT